MFIKNDLAQRYLILASNCSVLMPWSKHGHIRTCTHHNRYLDSSCNFNYRKHACHLLWLLLLPSCSCLAVFIFLPIKIRNVKTCWLKYPSDLLFESIKWKLENTQRTIARICANERLPAELPDAIHSLSIQIIKCKKGFSEHENMSINFIMIYGWMHICIQRNANAIWKR